MRTIRLLPGWLGPIFGSPRSGSLMSTLVVWHDRYFQRRQFARLDDRMLKDVGATEKVRDEEIAKPFWQE